MGEKSCVPTTSSWAVRCPHNIIRDLVLTRMVVYFNLRYRGDVGLDPLLLESALKGFIREICRA